MLKETDPPPQLQLPPVFPPGAAGDCVEVCSFWTLLLDTESTASTRSPGLAVSKPEIRYRPSAGAVKIPADQIYKRQ